MRFAKSWPKDLAKPEAHQSERDFCPNCFWVGNARDLVRETGEYQQVSGHIFRSGYRVPVMEKLPCPGCGADTSTFGKVINDWPLRPILARPASLQAVCLIEGWQQPEFESRGTIE